MTITVRFFAALREKVGVAVVRVESGPESDLAQVLTMLRGRLSHEAFSALSAANVRVAVNKEFIEGGCVLRDGDEVAFMPPITGG